MGIDDYVIERVTITGKGGSFDVRGLSVGDVQVLMGEHLKDLDAILDIYSKSVNPNLLVAETAQFAVSLIREAPGLVANAIALAADDPTKSEKTAKFPIPVQVKALKEIVRLTFEEAGGTKNFFESLKELMVRVRPPHQTDSLT